MSKNVVQVTIGGEVYTVRSELPPEYTREVAAYLDAALSRVLDIPTILGNVDEAFVGFTSGTGDAFGNHDIISWEYRSEFDPIPEPSTYVLACLGGLALLVVRRRQKRAAV